MSKHLDPTEAAGATRAVWAMEEWERWRLMEPMVGKAVEVRYSRLRRASLTTTRTGYLVGLGQSATVDQDYAVINRNAKALMLVPFAAIYSIRVLEGEPHPWEDK